MTWWHMASLYFMWVEFVATAICLGFIWANLSAAGEDLHLVLLSGMNGPRKSMARSHLIRERLMLGAIALLLLIAIDSVRLPVPLQADPVIEQAILYRRVLLIGMTVLLGVMSARTRRERFVLFEWWKTQDRREASREHDVREPDQSDGPASSPATGVSL